MHVFELTRLPAVSDGSSLWDWILFIKSQEEKELEMLKERNADIGQAVEELYRVSADDTVRYQYEVREKTWRDEQARLDYSLHEGLQRGLKQGIKQGMQQGMQRGIQQGIVETARASALCGILLGSKIGTE